MVLLLAINTDLKAYETLGNQPKKKENNKVYQQKNSFP